MRSDLLVLTVVALTTASLAFLISVYSSVYDSSIYQGGLAERVNSYLSSPLFEYKDELLGGFTVSERSHLKDVKRLLDHSLVAYKALSVFLLAAFLYCLSHDELLIFKKGLLGGGGVLFFATLLTGFFFMLSFDAAWTAFHKVFFPQGNWEFPSSSLLITSFPEELFQREVSAVIAKVLLLSAALVSIGAGKCKKRKLPVKLV